MTSDVDAPSVKIDENTKQVNFLPMLERISKWNYMNKIDVNFIKTKAEWKLYDTIN